MESLKTYEFFCQKLSARLAGNRERHSMRAAAFFPLDGIEQTVQVTQVGRVASHAGDVATDKLDNLW